MASAVSGATRAHSREEQLACKVQMMAKVPSVRQSKTPAQVDEEVSSVLRAAVRGASDPHQLQKLWCRAAITRQLTRECLSHKLSVPVRCCPRA